MSVNIKNFSLANVVSAVLTATPSSVRIPLPDQVLEDVMIVNDGSVIVYVRTGDSAVVADINAMPILPGEKGVYSKGLLIDPITHIAAFVVAATADILVIQGAGA